jgi:hypothetical protein
MKTHFIYSCLCPLFIFFCCPWLSSAETEVEADRTKTKSDDTPLNVASDPALCKKEVLLTFFPKPVVKSVLMNNKIPEDKAEAIATELAGKDNDIVKTVENRAFKMDSQFKDFSQRDVAIKAYHETLYEVFANVLKAHGLTDEDQTQTLLDDIRATKGRLFVECIRKSQTIPATPP